jgi:hypothetical protein
MEWSQADLHKKHRKINLIFRKTESLPLTETREALP